MIIVCRATQVSIAVYILGFGVRRVDHGKATSVGYVTIYLAGMSKVHYHFGESLTRVTGDYCCSILKLHIVNANLFPCLS
jgi:hypothetical protein